MVGVSPTKSPTEVSRFVHPALPFPASAIPIRSRQDKAKAPPAALLAAQAPDKWIGIAYRNEIPPQTLRQGLKVEFCRMHAARFIAIGSEAISGVDHRPDSVDGVHTATEHRIRLEVKRSWPALFCQLLEGGGDVRPDRPTDEATDHRGTGQEAPTL